MAAEVPLLAAHGVAMPGLRIAKGHSQPVAWRCVCGVALQYVFVPVGALRRNGCLHHIFAREVGGAVEGHRAASHRCQRVYSLLCGVVGC